MPQEVLTSISLSTPMSASSDSQYQCPEIMYWHDALLILERNDTEVNVIYDRNKCISLRMATVGDLAFAPSVEQTLSCMRTVFGLPIMRTVMSL